MMDDLSKNSFEIDDLMAEVIEEQAHAENIAICLKELAERDCINDEHCIAILTSHGVDLNELLEYRAVFFPDQLGVESILTSTAEQRDTILATAENTEDAEIGLNYLRAIFSRAYLVRQFSDFYGDSASRQDVEVWITLEEDIRTNEKTTWLSAASEIFDGPGLDSDDPATFTTIELIAKAEAEQLLLDRQRHETHKKFIKEWTILARDFTPHDDLDALRMAIGLGLTAPFVNSSVDLSAMHLAYAQRLAKAIGWDDSTFDSVISHLRNSIG